MAAAGISKGDGVPPTRFAEARGARIAYQDYGQDEPIVVAIPPTAQNVEMAWEWPAVRRMLDRFGSFSRWIQFDKRGTGASDRRSQVPGIDERVDDLRAVMDAASVQRAFLYGASEGGPTCLLFAATYPERVEGVILHGSAAYTERQGMSDEEIERVSEHYARFCRAYGTDDSPMVDGFAPSLADDPEFRAWHIRYERTATDPQSLREALEISLGVDVRPILGKVEVPVLLLHRADDPIIPIAWARETAAALPDARLVECEGNDHFAYVGDQSWLDDLERFVTGTVREPTEPLRDRPTVEIQTLGRFAVVVDGNEVANSAWGSRKARQVCKRLVAARGWPVTRDELFEMLWPDESDPRVLGARLSVQLSSVRRILGGGVVADRQTVALDLGAISTDLELLHTSDDRTAIDHYRGEFLPEESYDDWAAAPRDEARLVFRRAAHRVVDEFTAAADHGAAADLMRRVVGFDRFDDHAHARLVEELAASGDEAEARRAHDERAAAMDELGVVVGPYPGG